MDYTLELSGKETRWRYYANFTGIPINDLVERKDEVKEKYKEGYKGRLFVQQYPMRGAGVETIKAHLEKCERTPDQGECLAACGVSHRRPPLGRR